MRNNVAKKVVMDVKLENFLPLTSNVKYTTSSTTVKANAKKIIIEEFIENISTFFPLVSVRGFLS
jgi:hypothetical protein